MPSQRPEPEPAELAEQAYRSLKALAHVSGRFADDPDQMYDVIGSLSTGLATLRYVLDQLAFWHQHHAPRAVFVAGGALVGTEAAHRAANNLTTASHELEAALRLVEMAHNLNGQVAWRPADHTAHRTPLAPGSAFGSGPTSGGNVIRFPGR